MTAHQTPPATQPSATVGEVERARTFLGSFQLGFALANDERQMIAEIMAQFATLHTPPPVATATVVDAGEVPDWSKPIEAVHDDGRTIPMKVAQLNAGVYGNNDHWLYTANRSRFPGGPGSISALWARKDGFIGAYPGWRIRNAATPTGGIQS